MVKYVFFYIGTVTGKLGCLLTVKYLYLAFTLGSHCYTLYCKEVIRKALPTFKGLGLDNKCVKNHM